MKFHCDRCKTKYSISDDRVRGKILKIRCKNCSAVITVREPAAGAGKAGATSAAATGQSSRKPSAADRQASKGQEALAGAFKKAVSETNAGGSAASAAPVSLDAEWYLSKDGEQEGPFALDEARNWVRARAASDELYVWSEGYDDWLAIEKVSHFRGVRRAPAQTATEDYGDEMTMVQAHADLSFLENTPKPLFAATMAAVTGGHPESIEEALPSAVSRPSLGRSTSPSALSPSPSPSAPSPSAPSPSAPSPSAPLPSASAPSPSSALPSASAPSPSAASSSRAPAIPQNARAPAMAQTRAPSIPSKASPAGKDASTSLDFDIGEASRVVDLATLMAQRGNAPRLTPGGNPMPGVDASIGRGSGAMQSVVNPAALAAPLAAADLPPSLAGSTPNAKRRRGALVPLIAAGVLMAAAGGLLLYFSMSDSPTGSSVPRGTVGGGDNLGFSFNERGERIIIVNPAQKDVEEETEKDKGSSGKGKKASTPQRSNNTGNSNKEPAHNTGEVDLSGSGPKGPTGPLDADDLNQVYRKNSIAIKMCYESSLKRNPLLKVPKTLVDIRVGLDGRVISVTIPSLAGTELGRCLTGRISRWRFRSTTELFSSRFPLVFGS